VRPWYETAFQGDYLDRYPHRDVEEARGDVAAIVRLLDPPRDAPILDLGCGAGRHLVALHEAGFRDIAGLDLSTDLLEVARKSTREAGATSIELIHADMRRIPYAARFATILSMFTSFGYFRTDDEDAAVLASAHRALRPGGRLLIDTLAKEKTIADLVSSEERVVEGSRLCIRRTISPDGRRVEKETVTCENGATTTRRESVRLYAPGELVGMLHAAGFGEAAAYGSLAGERPTAESRRLVVVGRKDEA
jgi:SAM-dependent methyltransferase